MGMLLCEASTTAGSRLATAVPELVITAAGRLQATPQAAATLGTLILLDSDWTYKSSATCSLPCAT